MAQDRNEKARQEFQMGQERRKFAHALAAGQTGVVDRFGAMVTQGDLVVWEPANSIVCEVVEVSPVLDPRAPIGLVRMTVTMNAPLTFPAGQPQIGIMRCGRQQAPGHASLETPQGAEAEHPALPSADPAPEDDIEKPTLSEA